MHSKLKRDMVLYHHVAFYRVDEEVPEKLSGTMHQSNLKIPERMKAGVNLF